jgi:hypothetical protein
MPIVGFLVLAFFLFFGQSWSELIEEFGVITSLFMMMFLFLLTQLMLSSFLLSLNDTWEIKGNELTHRFAYEVRRHDISKIESFGPPLIYRRGQWFFRGERERHLIADGRVVDRMRFPFIYGRADLDAFFEALKRANPQISFEPKLARKFWTGKY